MQNIRKHFTDNTAKLAKMTDMLIILILPVFHFSAFFLARKNFVHPVTVVFHKPLFILFFLVLLNSFVLGCSW